VNSQVTVTESEVLEMLASAFEEPVSELRREVTKDDVPGWDSMGALALMAAFDEKLGLELTAAEFREMQKVGDVLDFLQQRGALVNAAHP